jgi:hypothetical protein
LPMPARVRSPIQSIRSHLTFPNRSVGVHDLEEENHQP